MNEYFTPSAKVALQFSGGRDSLALLFLMRPFWDKLTVYYCNSGAAFPETLDLIEKVKSLTPHFVEVDGNQSQVIALNGYPSDLVPANSTYFGRMVGSQALPMQDRYSCCLHSIMLPMDAQMRKDGITTIFRGQRNSDRLKSPTVSGQQYDIFTLVYPLADWSTVDVIDYLKSVPFEVPYYKHMTSGGDCLDCTAWLEHNQLDYLNEFHPLQARETTARLRSMHATIIPIMEILNGRV